MIFLRCRETLLRCLPSLFSTPANGAPGKARTKNTEGELHDPHPDRHAGRHLDPGIRPPGNCRQPDGWWRAMYETKNIVENAVNSKDHTTLVAAVQAAGLATRWPARAPSPSSLRSTRPSKPLPAGTVETLLKPGKQGSAHQDPDLPCRAADALSEAINKMIAMPTAASMTSRPLAAAC